MTKRLMFAMLLALLAFTAGTNAAWADSDPSGSGPVSTEAP